MSAVRAIKIKSGDSPTFVFKNTLVKNLLNYASIGENSNKFYRIEVQEGTNNSDYPFRVYTEYGRVGKACMQEGRYFIDRYSAGRCFKDIISQKNGKGYSVVALEDDPYAARYIKKPKVDLSPIKDSIHRLVAKFYQEAAGFITATIETPLGKISAQQVQKGSQIIRIRLLFIHGKRPSTIEFFRMGVWWASNATRLNSRVNRISE
jgi:poly [ADP-ribose] polymerase